MSVVEKENRRAKAATRTLREISSDAITKGEVAVDLIDDQILHGANFASESEPPPVEPLAEKIPVDAETERKIGELLDQIGEGLRADEKTNREKLDIARKYGPVVVALKAITDHGKFMKKLKERFPKTKYPTLNRWMMIADNEIEVASAIEKYPEVAWGPTKMINYLKGWNPEEEQEQEEDEENVAGFPAENNLNRELLLYDDSSKTNPQNKAVTQTEDTPNSPKLKEVKSAKPKVVGEVAEGNTSANKQPNNLKAKEASVIAEDADADSAVNKLNTLTKQLLTLYERMERLDWDKESKDEWDDALVRLKAISVKITNKALKVIGKGSPQEASGKSPKRPTKAKN